MPNRPPTPRDAYCVRCLASAAEQDLRCGRCRAPFVGSGAFDRIRGPRPSALFVELLAAAPGTGAVRQ